MEVLIDILIIAGLSLLLEGCRGSEEDDDIIDSVNVEFIPNDKFEKAAETEDDVSTANDNVLLKCTSGGEKIIPLKDASGNYIQKGKLLTETDTNIEEGFIYCNTAPDENGKCIPQIEKGKWQCTNTSHTSNMCDTVNCNSFMFCLYGYGIIYVHEDGQQEGEMKAFGAFCVMELWLEEGYDTIPAERLSQALEDARNYGEQKSIKNFGDDEEKYKKVDTSILAWTNFWNARQVELLGAGNFTPVRAEIIKCIIKRESSMGTDGDKNGKRDVSQSLFSGDPTIWVITKLNPYEEGKTHKGEEDPQVIDVIFENGERHNGSIPSENFNPNDVKYQEWFDNGEWKIYSEVITNQEGQCYTYYREKVSPDMSICSGIGAYSYYLNKYQGLASEAEALAGYKGGSDEENRNYVQDINASMDLMKENLDGYDEYTEKN